MATLAEISRARKADFRLLLKASRSLDAAQEKVEREIKRLVSRKNSVPEAADADRIAGLISQTADELGSISNLMTKIAQTWTLA